MAVGDDEIKDAAARAEPHHVSLLVNPLDSPLLLDALSPPSAPAFYRHLGWIPSVRAVGRHIGDYASHWRDEVDRAVAADRPVVVVLGDSLAQGIGASSPAAGYAGLLRAWWTDAEGPLPIVNLSRSGARIADVADVQLPALEALVAGGLVVAGGACTVGSNDLRHSFRVDRIGRDLADLERRLPDGVALATLPEAGSAAARCVNRAVRASTAASGRPLADVGRRLRTWRGRVSGDGFHPNDAGHRVWFEAIIEGLGEIPQDG